jgi:cytochrome c553
MTLREPSTASPTRRRDLPAGTLRPAFPPVPMPGTGDSFLCEPAARHGCGAAYLPKAMTLLDTLNTRPILGRSAATFVLVALSLPFSPALAQDANIGRQKAQACAVCHGVLGLASVPNTPHLAGQPAPYVEAQLRAFRSGTRRNEVMAVIAKPLTDEDIAQLAAWYASIKIDVQPPQ